MVFGLRKRLGRSTTPVAAGTPVPIPQRKSLTVAALPQTATANYPTESRIRAYVDETIAQQQPAPVRRIAPPPSTAQRMPPPMPTGYESDDQLVRTAKYYAAGNKMLTEDDNSSHTSDNDELYSTSPPCTRHPVYAPFTAYPMQAYHTYDPEVTDQYYERPPTAQRQPLGWRELYSYTETPVARDSGFAPGLRFDGTSQRSAYAAERFQKPDTSYTRRRASPYY